tara:strand:+ start:1197 stop:1604 length:408 start_codon:yes stop_codon:yes gene_type:complete
MSKTKKRTATFLGPNKGISIAREFAYAYSGTKQATTGETTLLEFTTGNEIIVGKITCAGAIPNNGSGVGSGVVSAFTLTFNGEEVTRMKTETLQEDSPTFTVYPILFPPHTSIKLVVLSNGTAGKTSAIIVGRIY